MRRTFAPAWKTAVTRLWNWVARTTTVSSADIRVDPLFVCFGDVKRRVAPVAVDDREENRLADTGTGGRGEQARAAVGEILAGLPELPFQAIDHDVGPVQGFRAARRLW